MAAIAGLAAGLIDAVITPPAIQQQRGPVTEVWPTGMVAWAMDTEARATHMRPLATVQQVRAMDM